MKKINVYFEDKEFEQLKKYKKTLTWHDFIMELTKPEDKNERTKKHEKGVKID